MDFLLKVIYASVNKINLNKDCLPNCKTCIAAMVGNCTSCYTGSTLLNGICCANP